MKKIGTRGFTTIVLLLVIVGLIYYTYLNNNASNRKKVDESSEVQQLLEYDFVNNYPKTVRETVKLHLNYLKNTNSLMKIYWKLIQKINNYKG